MHEQRKTPISSFRSPGKKRRRTPIALGALSFLTLTVGYGAPSRAAGVDDGLGEEVVRFESARIVRKALERGGNTNYAIRFFLDAEHGLRSSPDGFAVREQLVPGYAPTVASWVKDVARGEEPGPSIAGPVPEQACPSEPLAPLAWWESAWAQVGAMVVSALAFTSYPATTLVRRLRRPLLRRAYTQPNLPARRFARCLASAGLAAILGFVGYFSFLTFTAASAVGPVVARRLIPWLVLQALAVAA